VPAKLASTWEQRSQLLERARQRRSETQALAALLADGAIRLHVCQADTLPAGGAGDPQLRQLVEEWSGVECSDQTPAVVVTQCQLELLPDFLWQPEQQAGDAARVPAGADGDGPADADGIYELNPRWAPTNVVMDMLVPAPPPAAHRQRDVRDEIFDMVHPDGEGGPACSAQPALQHRRWLPSCPWRPCDFVSRATVLQRGSCARAP
jgi:hypothetical protein